jgi:exonuclease SbcC
MGLLPGVPSIGTGEQGPHPRARTSLPAGGGRIRLRYLELRNYRKFRSSAIEFPDGVIGILGQNGVGKSTLVEAVAWALYGNEKMIVRTGKESIRNASAGANEDCAVNLVFDIAGDEYKLYRAMRGRSNAVDASLTVNGQLKASGEKAVTQAVEKLLGMDYKAFFISVFARQKELNALSILNPSERKKLVLRMLGIDRLDEVVVAIDRDLNAVKAELETLQRDLLTPEGRSRSELERQGIGVIEEEASGFRKEAEALQAQLDGINGQIAQARSERDSLAKKDGQHRDLLTQAVRADAELTAINETIGRLDNSLSSLRSKQPELAILGPEANRHEELTREKDALDQELKRAEQRKSLQTALEASKRKIGSIEQELTAKRQTANDCAGARSSLERVESNMEQLRGDREEKRQAARSAELDFKRLGEEQTNADEKRQEIARLGRQSKCPTCERELCDQHDFLLKKLEKEASERSEERDRLKHEKEKQADAAKQLGERLNALEDRKKELQKKCDEAAKAEEALERMQRQLTTLREECGASETSLSALGEVDFDEQHYESVKTSLVQLRKKVERFNELRTQMARLPELEEEKGQALTQRDAVEAKQTQVERQIGDLGYESGSLLRTQQRLDELSTSKDAMLARSAKLQSELASRSSELKGRRTRLEDVERQERNAEEATRRLEEQQVLSTGMKEFRKNVMARVVPTLSEVSAALFAELTDNKYQGMMLDDNYDIFIFDKGEKHALSRFSGGETDLANLCLRLAISRVIADKAGSAVNFLILDEIFGSQDQVRKRGIMNAFEQLSKQFKQIFLITHIEDVKDLMSNAITVREREDGSSELILQA